MRFSVVKVVNDDEDREAKSQQTVRFPEPSRHADIVYLQSVYIHWLWLLLGSDVPGAW